MMVAERLSSSLLEGHYLGWDLFEMNYILSMVFFGDVLALVVLLLGILWSVAIPTKRIWPPPSKGTWQHLSTWVLYFVVFGSNSLIIILDWNSWLIDSPLRFILGIPLTLIGSLLLLWGIRTLGTKNTSGLSDGFINEGPYRFTRNPQYLGDMLLLVGLSIIANSLMLWVTHALLILIFVITPIAEEDWLKVQYGDDYRVYFEGTSRFL